MECDPCSPSRPFVVLPVDRFVGHGGSPLERQKQDSRVYRKYIFELCLLADQNPRKFFDQRDAGLYICRWPGSPPEDPFRHSSEVSSAFHPNCVQFVPVSFSRCINFRLCNCFIFLSRNVKKEWRMCYEVLCQIWVFLSVVKRLLTLGHAHGMSRNSYSQRDDLAMQVTILSTLHIRD